MGGLAALDRRTAAARIRDLSQQYGLAVDPDAYVRDLTVGAQQRVEIVKALYRAADILILDEPTAVLTPQEADELFVIMRGMVTQGKSIVFITHKLREVFAVADPDQRDARRPDGRHGEAGRGHARAAGRDDGGPQGDPADRQGGGAPGRRRCCSVEDLRVLDDRHHVTVDGVSLEVRAGEILGIAGVQGNGQTELAEALTGLRQVVGGTVTICWATTRRTRRRASWSKSGMAHVPEDRHKHGLVLSFPVRDNLVLCTYYRPPFANGIELDYPVIAAEAERLVQMFDMRTPGIMTSAGSLSGGNQQKVIVARELSRIAGDVEAATVAPAGRQPADARPGCGQHRVHPPPHRGGARQRRGRAADQRRAG